VSDKTKTLGHTASATATDWHPLERKRVLTASSDGTARLWNLQGKTQFEMLVCEKVFQAKSSRGHRTEILSLCFHPGGRELALWTICGSIQIWNISRISNRPERAAHAAHDHNGSNANAGSTVAAAKPISSLAYSVRLSQSSTLLVSC
jgi:WD40 repeat protein